MSQILNVLRKRFLVWRTLAPASRQEYCEPVPSEFAPSTDDRQRYAGQPT